LRRRRLRRRPPGRRRLVMLRHNVIRSSIMGRRLTVTVDKSRCVGNQMCMQHAPGVFEPDAEGRSTVVDVSKASEEAIVEAGLDCPTAAISVVDADTGEDLLA